MLFHRCALLSGLTFLVLSTAACGLSSDVDAIFSKNGESSNSGGSGGASSSGSAAGGSGGGSTTAAGGSTTQVGGGTTGGTGGGGTGGSGATGGGGTTGGTGGGGTGGGTTTTPSIPEDCLDGTDNDGDGAIDCADSDCTPDFQCVPNVPNGWQGYRLLSQTDFPTPPGACDGGAMPTVYFAGPAGPPECTACTCGDLAGGSCSAPQISCWAGSSNCNGQETDWTGALADGNCHKPGNLLGFNNQLSCELKGASQVLTPGACKPSVADFANKNTWKNEIGACSLPPAGGGCGAAQICLPKAGGADKVCLQKNGDVPCPAGPQLDKVVAFSSGTDDRSCSACKCGDGSGSCAGTGYQAFDLDQCAAGGDAPVSIDSAACKNVSALLDMGSWAFKETGAQPKGSCPPDGGQAQGQVNPQGPVTFCCKQ